MGFDEFLPYLTGASDGQAKDADWAAAITEVPADEIRALARRMVARRTLINCSLSVQRQHHGEQAYWALVMLAAMLGQIGLPGGGFGCGYGTGGAGVPRRHFPVPKLPAGRNPTGAYIPVARISDMLLEPGGECRFNGQTLRYPDMRLIYWVRRQPVSPPPGPRQAAARLATAGHGGGARRLVDADRPPCRHRAAVHDRAGAGRLSSAMLLSDRYIVANRAAIAPIGQARPEFDIFAALAERSGVGAAFTEGRDAAGWLRHVYEEARSGAARMQVELPDFDSFWQAGHVEVPAKPEPHVMLAGFRADPDAHRLGTPSGRIELYSETIAGFGYDDCPPHPTWLEPAEWLGSPLAAQVSAASGHQPAAHAPAQPARHGPGQSGQQDRRPRTGVDASGRRRRARSARRRRRAAVQRPRRLPGRPAVTDLIRPGVVQIATGAWYDPAEPGQPRQPVQARQSQRADAGHRQLALAQAPISQTTLVEVERAVTTRRR